MRDYRAFVIGSDGHIKNRFEFYAEDDERAKEQAKQLVDGHAIELWHQTEMIAEFKPSREGESESSA